jgi:endogenous inhibitor of DNA gyrase (YacG/DUF329 family)
VNEDDVVYIRESHMVPCPECGYHWDDWDSSLRVAEAVSQADTVDDLFTRSCPQCGEAMSWDTVIAPDADPVDESQLHAHIAEMLSAHQSPEEIARDLRSRFGVVAFYVRSKG